MRRKAQKELKNRQHPSLLPLYSEEREMGHLDGAGKVSLQVSGGAGRGPMVQRKSGLEKENLLF